jgi:hypothetical protein
MNAIFEKVTKSSDGIQLAKSIEIFLTFEWFHRVGGLEEILNYLRQ